MPQTIMLIDDEPEILNMLKRYFSLEGYDVITAAGGTEALQKLKMSPDLILLDVNMPDLDGISLCGKIRDFVSCPILFLTANTQDSDKIQGFSAGGRRLYCEAFFNRRAWCPRFSPPAERKSEQIKVYRFL